MNIHLLEVIVKHIYSNLLVIPSDFVDPTGNKSIIDKEFLLDKKLSFEDEDGKQISNNIWGCQMFLQNKAIKVLCGDCSTSDNKEYALLVSYTDSPMYAAYSIFNSEYLVSQEALIAVSMDGSGWLECNTFLQASFLAAMEQLKDFGLSWQKCENPKQELDSLKSFIKYHDALFE